MKLGIPIVTRPTQMHLINYAPNAMIHIQPLDEHRMSRGIPGAIDEAFAGELTNRYMIDGELRSDSDIGEEIQEHRTIRTFGYENEESFGNSDYKDRISNWLQEPN